MKFQYLKCAKWSFAIMPSMLLLSCGNNDFPQQKAPPAVQKNVEAVRKALYLTIGGENNPSPPDGTDNVPPRSPNSLGTMKYGVTELRGIGNAAITNELSKKEALVFYFHGHGVTDVGVAQIGSDVAPPTEFIGIYADGVLKPADITVPNPYLLVYMDGCFTGLNPARDEFINKFTAGRLPDAKTQENPEPWVGPAYFGWKIWITDSGGHWFARFFFKHCADRKTIKTALDDARSDFNDFPKATLAVFNIYFTTLEAGTLPYVIHLPADYYYIHSN